MKITLLVIGRTTDSRIASLTDDYVNRLSHYIPFAIQVIGEIKKPKALSIAEQKRLEGEVLLKNIPANADLILLDERGKEYKSTEFANYLQQKMNTGRDIVFVIGGAYGFSEDVYAKATDKIALSQMTFSHQMVRLFFAEQIYRAMTIIKGESYHH